MLKLFLMFFSLFTTQCEWTVASEHYSDVQISSRYYIRNYPWAEGVADWRFFVDTTHYKGNTLTHIHPESWIGGVGYESGIYLGWIDGRFHLFGVDWGFYEEPPTKRRF